MGVDTLTAADGERQFIAYVLAFFAASDGIVVENLAIRFMQGEVDLHLQSIDTAQARSQNIKPCHEWISIVAT